MNVAVPGATATSVNVALDAPAWIVTGVCTVATAVLLLDSETAVPPVGAATVRLTVPCALLPAATLDTLSATLDTAGTAAGAVGELH